MYKLDNNVEWTTELKNAFKTGTTRAKIIYDGDSEINESNSLKQLELKDTQYVPNLGIIGQAVAKELTFSFVNKNNINLENKEVTLKIGAEYNGDVYYITYGNFIVMEAPKNDNTNEVTSVVAYDYMKKFDIPYEDTITYPCTLRELAEDICEKVGVELGSESFSNEDFIVVDNQFTGKTAREVIQNIAKCAFSWARIGQDNKLHFDFEANEEIEVEGSNIIVTNAIEGNIAQINRIKVPETSTTSKNTSFTITDAPVEIQSVSGDNDIFTSSKNIISNSDMTQAPGNNDNWVLGTLNSVTTSSWTSDGLTVTTPASGNQNNGRTIQLRNANDFIPAGTIVTFSIDISGTGTFGRIRGFYQGTGTAFYSKSIPIISDTSTTDSTTRRYTGTFTMPNVGTKNKDFYIALSQGNTAVTTRTYKNVQLEISQTATTYEKHQGERYQIDLGGKNLFNKNSTSIIANKRIATGSGGTYSETGYSVSDYIRVESNTYYTLTSGIQSYIAYYDSNKTKVACDYTAWNSGQAKIAPTNAVYLRFDFQTINIDIIQLEKGTVATRYSPYVSNPIELCKIDSYVDTLKKSEGKQLFDKDQLTVGYINADGTIYSSATNYATSDFIPVQSNTAYYKTYTASPRTKFFNANKEPLSTSSYQDLSIGGNAGSFTPPANAVYFRFSFPTNGTVTNIMLNEGETALPYEPYGTNWYIEKNVGKYDSWTNVNRTSSFTNTNSYQFVLPIPTDSTKRATVLCNYFQNAINNNDNEHVFIGTNVTNVYAGLNVFISKTRVTTSEEAINWLKNKGVEVYYILANPTYEIITNENLIEQLNQIQNIQMQGGKTNIFWTGEVAPTMTLKYNQNYLSEDNEVTVRGKNLIQLTDGIYSSNGITAVVSNGKITLNRTSTSSGTSFVNIPLVKKIIINPNDKYTFSANNNFTLGNTSQSGSYACIRFRTSSTDDSTNDVLFGTLDNSKIIQKDTTWTYEYLRVRTASSLSYTNNEIYPQLELRRNKNNLRAL